MAYLEVIPGYQFADGEALTYAKLNAAAQPVIDLTTALFNILSSGKNALDNGNFLLWQRGTTKSCSAGAKTWVADRWFARPSGAAVTYARDTILPDNAIAAYSAKLTGASSVTTVDFGQRIESFDAHANWQRTRVFSAWIYNNSGAAFAPKLIINTPTGADNYAATNAGVVNATLQTCASGAWTQVSYAFDGSALTGVANGVEIVLQIPSGSLDGTGKTVNITQCQCEPGSVVTDQEPRSYAKELEVCERYCLALNDQVIGFAADATNFESKGIFTLPVTMRAKPVFDGNNTSVGDNVHDFYTDATGGGNNGTPVISGYAGNVVMALANNAANWTAGHQINLTACFTAEDQS